jgi:hypothetical protein
LLRYTRLMFNKYLKMRMQDLLGYGLAMEKVALMEQSSRQSRSPFRRSFRPTPQDQLRGRKCATTSA